MADIAEMSGQRIAEFPARFLIIASMPGMDIR